MVNLSLSKEELDVVYYALKRYSLEKRESVGTFEKAANITGFESPKFVAKLIKESAVADKLCDDCIGLMLDMIRT